MTERNDPFNLGPARDFLADVVRSLQGQLAAEPKEDWTDPGYVLGAVLAQIEDLSPQDKVSVLADALTAVIPELR